MDFNNQLCIHENAGYPCVDVRCDACPFRYMVDGVYIPPKLFDDQPLHTCRHGIVDGIQCSQCFNGDSAYRDSAYPREDCCRDQMTARELEIIGAENLKNSRCRDCPDYAQYDPRVDQGWKTIDWKEHDLKETRLPARLEGTDFNEALGRSFTDAPEDEEVSLFMPEDFVNHPQHYARWKMEPIEFIAINDLPWWLANVIKYTMRFDAKDGIKDLYKARSYLEMKIRQLEGHKRFWDRPVSVERELSR